MSRNKKKKQKLRVAFRKNRQKRARRSNLTREVEPEGDETQDLATGERVRARGDVARYRTVVGVEDADDQVILDVDAGECIAGRVLTARGLQSIVRGEDGIEYECTIRRLLRTLERESRNVVVTGDRVLVRPAGRDAERDQPLGVIERVEPRSGVISRSSRGSEHVIVANIEQALLVFSADDPPLKPNLIDRLIVSAEKGEVRPIICINKCDLVDPGELQPLAGVYGRLGYDVVMTSAVTMRGIDRLRDLLADSESVFTGQSGVGKSSLLNSLQPGLALQVGDVAADSRKGTHTTRAASLIELEFGGWVVDTPGIRQFALWDVIAEEVEGFFIEFRPFVTLCRYPDCTHTHEAGCGVKNAVQSGLISADRYGSSCRLLEDEPAR